MDAKIALRRREIADGDKLPILSPERVSRGRRRLILEDSPITSESEIERVAETVTETVAQTVTETVAETVADTVVTPTPSSTHPKRKCRKVLPYAS